MLKKNGLATISRANGLISDTKKRQAFVAFREIDITGSAAAMAPSDFAHRSAATTFRFRDQYAVRESPSGVETPAVAAVGLPLTRGAEAERRPVWQTAA